MKTILIVEDDMMIASGITYTLQQEGYEVDHVTNVKEALIAISKQVYILVLLDLSLPDGSGYTVFEEIKQKCDTPIIFLTAVDDEGNTVKGLEMGADDYITKPFRIKELLARIKTVLRRAGAGTELSSKFIYLGDIQIDTAQAKVMKKGNEIILTSLEYRLLLIFANHKNQILSRNQLLMNLWDIDGNYVNDNTLTVYIKRLREKIGDNNTEHEIIKTIRGLGYKAGD